jgi:hypothetical protein
MLEKRVILAVELHSIHKELPRHACQKSSWTSLLYFPILWYKLKLTLELDGKLEVWKHGVILKRSQTHSNSSSFLLHSSTCNTPRNDQKSRNSMFLISSRHPFQILCNKFERSVSVQGKWWAATILTQCHTEKATELLSLTLTSQRPHELWATRRWWCRRSSQTSTKSGCSTGKGGNCSNCRQPLRSSVRSPVKVAKGGSCLSNGQFLRMTIWSAVRVARGGNCCNPLQLGLWIKGPCDQINA